MRKECSIWGTPTRFAAAMYVLRCVYIYIIACAYTYAVCGTITPFRLMDSVLPLRTAMYVYTYTCIYIYPYRYLCIHGVDL